MDFLNTLIDAYNIPILTAFLLGIITALSPCPLATNITAVAYISKQFQSPKKTILHGLVYALGRVVSYVALVLLVIYGFSTFEISSIFQGRGDKVLGPILLILGLIMIGVIKIPSFGKGDAMDKTKNRLSKQGYMGTFLLGMLFALAFCPYSGVMFFGVLLPLIIKTNGGLGLSLLFGLGTSLPVIVFSFLLAISVKKMSKAFGTVGKIEKWIRWIIAFIFIVVGLYYCWLTAKRLIAIL